MKFILASHGGASVGMLDTLQMLLGPQEDIEAFSLLPEEEPQRLGERIAQSLGESDEGNVIVFTDLYFGSPFNQVVELSRTHDLYHVTGMNIPALIEAVCARDSGMTCEEICKIAVEAGAAGVKDVRALLQEDQTDSEEEEEW